MVGAAWLQPQPSALRSMLKASDTSCLSALAIHESREVAVVSGANSVNIKSGA